MPGTRSSARQAAKSSSSPAASQEKTEVETGSKRKASNSTSPSNKRGKKAEDAVQTTIEDTLPLEGGKTASEDVEMADQDNTEEKQEVLKKDEHDAEQKDTATEEPAKPSELANGKHNEADVVEPANGEGKEGEQNGAKPEPAEDAKEEEKLSNSADTAAPKSENADDAVQLSQSREKAVPSTILEKGIIYFFFRGRVGIEEPGSVGDIARSYIVLRPLPKGAKLGDGPIGDQKTNKLLALPKKVLPKSPKDRFMTFVEKANVSMDEIKETLSSSDYGTKTMGDRHTPAAAPIGEGVYAITETGRDTHLAYILTIPSELNEVQEEIGLRKRNSYNTSAKNPQSSGPANAQLDTPAKFPKDIQDAFAGRGWMPLRPEMLSYDNCQFLIIGHGEGALEKAAEPQHGEEKKEDKETPLEEVEKLEHEDALRVKHLEGDNSIFADLNLESEQYPKLQTTW